MIRVIAILSAAALLSACGGSRLGGPGSYYPEYRPTPGQGQYVRPEWLNPTPTPMIPPVDSCRSQVYAGLVGQHEGAIYIPGLPGRKRILKPAFPEGFDYQEDDTFYDRPPLVEVREYLPGQLLYAPAINTVTDRLSLGPNDETRLTIELDQEGYIQEISCE